MWLRVRACSLQTRMWRVQFQALLVCDIMMMLLNSVLLLTALLAVEASLL